MTDKRSEQDPGTDSNATRDGGEPAFEWMRDPVQSSTADDGPVNDGPVGEEPENDRPVSDGPKDEAPAHEDPAPTGSLNVRPPEEDVQRRQAQREAVAKSRPVTPRILQILMAITFPFLLMIAAVRLVASPVFLWAEYFRPGFPGDGYGFSAEDRLLYGSYAVDYLGNFAGPRYLGDLVFPDGEKLFAAGEVSHMADVKLVVLSSFGAGILLAAFFLVCYAALRRTPGAFSRGLFAGSLVTLGLVITLAVLAVVGWQQFFTEFHRLFFADGTWTFSLEDTLIRLFPGQFWIDAAGTIGVLVLVTAVVTALVCWPRKKAQPA